MDAAARETDAWTTQRLLRWMHDYFSARAIDSPRITAELLLAHVLGCERLRLYMEHDRPASQAERTRLRELVRRVAAHEPVQYILGEAVFYGLTLRVSPCTLIPRPCTERIVEEAVRFARAAASGGGGDGEILDLGTGTGAIAIAVAKSLPKARIVATDVDAEILDLARENAAAQRVEDRIEFRVGSLYEPFGAAGDAERFDQILSNPPYIPDDEWNDPTMVARNVRDWEPQRALRGGSDGLDLIRPIVQGAAEFLKSGGLMAVEIADSQRDAVLELARATGSFETVDVLRDDEGHWRVLRANVRCVD